MCLCTRRQASTCIIQVYLCCVCVCMRGKWNVWEYCLFYRALLQKRPIILSVTSEMSHSYIIYALLCILSFVFCSHSSLCCRIDTICETLYLWYVYYYMCGICCMRQFFEPTCVCIYACVCIYVHVWQVKCLVYYLFYGVYCLLSILCCKYIIYSML